MKNVTCVFPNTNNIGDYVQTLPIYEAFPDCDIIDRENLSAICGNGRSLILNGWYAHHPNNVFPIHSGFKNHIIGFHLAQSAQSTFISRQLEIWKTDGAPIGCRDQSTYQFMQRHGIQTAYLSTCPSILNTGRGDRRPDRKVVVDFPTYLLKNSNSYHIESAIIPNYLSVSDKINLARNFLDFLYQKAEVVVTTRIHVALPCVAMGVPVIFYGDRQNERLSLLSDLGIPINHFPTFFPLSKSKRTFIQLLKYAVNHREPMVALRSPRFNAYVELLQSKISEIN